MAPRLQGPPGDAAAPPVGGVLVIDKPEGPTSHDVVARVRRALGTREVGHTGTLDPLATGVLALVVGRATRLAQFLSGRDKSYRARIRLGLATDSWDRTGVVVSEVEPGSSLPGTEAVEAALRTFIGEQEQLPPPFSAKRIAGVRAYELAREGRPVNVTPARVALRDARVERVERAFVDVQLSCSAGYYVRALADALGRQLGCGACLEALRRTASGGFTLEDALPFAALDEPRESVLARLVPTERALPDLPAVFLTEAGVRRARHGNDVGPGDWTGTEADRTFPGGSREEEVAVRLLDPGGRLLAIGRPTARPGVLHPAVVLG